MIVSSQDQNLYHGWSLLFFYVTWGEYPFELVDNNFWWGFNHDGKFSISYCGVLLLNFKCIRTGKSKLIFHSPTSSRSVYIQQSSSLICLRLILIMQSLDHCPQESGLVAQSISSSSLTKSMTSPAPSTPSSLALASTSVDELNDYDLMKIFGFLNLDHLLAIKRVSKRWHDVIACFKPVNCRNWDQPFKRFQRVCDKITL